MTDFILRPWRHTDLDSLVYHANNPRIAANLMDQFPHPYTHAHGEAFLTQAVGQDPVSLFALEIHGHAAGGIGLHPKTDIECKNAELGYWLSELYWGHGIMARAIPLVVQHGFQAFDITRIFARPFGHNHASIRVLQKCGFTLEAHFSQTFFKHGVFVDELYYGVRRGW